jgi:hypothetical protein
MVSLATTLLQSCQCSIVSQAHKSNPLLTASQLQPLRFDQQSLIECGTLLQHNNAAKTGHFPLPGPLLCMS